MSKASGISKYTGTSDFGNISGGNKGDVSRFRKGRAIGDIVAGVLLRLEEQNLGWADLEGEELRVSLPVEGVRPKIGERIFFRIEQLEPETILAMQPLLEGGFVTPKRLPLAKSALLYTEARNNLSTYLHENLWKNLKDVQDVEAFAESFISFLRRDEYAFSTFMDIEIGTAALTNAASRAGILSFRYMPWLCPDALGVELLIQKTGSVRTLKLGASFTDGSKIKLTGELGLPKFMFTLFTDSAGKSLEEQEGKILHFLRGLKEIKEAGCYKVEQNSTQVDVLADLLVLCSETGNLSGGHFRRKL